MTGRPENSVAAFRLGSSRLELVEGDITLQDVDVIVNAANARLAGGGGVDGAIHRAAGPGLMEACRRLGGCPTGSAVMTPGFALTARFVVHAVGPIWHGGGHGEAGLLESAYRTSLELAEREGLKSIALPSLSTGAYGYPMDKAALVALGTVRDLVKDRSALERIRFVLFGNEAFQVFRKSAEKLIPKELWIDG